MKKPVFALLCGVDLRAQGTTPQYGPPTLNFEVFDMPPGAPLVAYVGGVPGTLTVPLANNPVLFVDPASAVTMIAVVNEFGYCNLPLTLPSPGAPFTFVVQALGMIQASEYTGPPDYNYYGAATNALEFVW